MFLTTPHQEGTPMNKKMVTAGLAAGLLAGTGAGFILQMSGSAGASGTTLSAVSVDDDTATDTATDTERPDPSVRLQEVLQPLVDDGTLTDDQATALRKLFVEHRPERPAEADRPAAGDRPTEAERTKAREAREAARTKALDETLSAAVDAGTIDQKEADAVRSKAEELKAQRPERPEKSGDDADAGKGSATDGSGG